MSNVTGCHVGPMIELMAPYVGTSMRYPLFANGRGNGPTRNQERLSQYPGAFEVEVRVPGSEDLCGGRFFCLLLLGGDKIWNVLRKIALQWCGATVIFLSDCSHRTFLFQFIHDSFVDEIVDGDA